jgi:DNA-directed RNA polymerase subunit alpha
MIPVPQKPKYTSLGDSHGKFEIPGCYPGYGATLGNALRRVLLSSLEGAAAHSVKISGASHEFSTLPGVMEDVVQILLNLKQVRFRLHGDEAVKVMLKAKGETEVTAGDIKTSSSVEVVNPDWHIATLTDKKAELEIELEIGRGIGYVPIEAREHEEREIGTIAIDAIYTPVRRVNYEVENMRVGKRTDYDKITLEVVTDGTISPEAAFEKAVAILGEQFAAIKGDEPTVSEAEPAKGPKKRSSKKKEE